ncbi:MULTISPECIES: hypothetical protein [Mesorhizobium]|uniref:Uncharacterized protein n=2 Tax=Mesorhizobium opportunistum TaxID=593909 RepID=A0ABV1YRL3_9HYPH|nr:hypothetical protein [Mesorhizobium sp.]TIN95164.1 MAG: hypothetical protein E5Y06_12680 [Mesorhizobium sp.]TJV00412.1 MAG: hypothetical protein E5Y08_03485 [Mesorhizobium sp.]TJV17649.1 MAG: hypothetical protein E5Y07_11150 [Mesorhizobium sp.]
MAESEAGHGVGVEGGCGLDQLGQPAVVAERIDDNYSYSFLATSPRAASCIASAHPAHYALDARIPLSEYKPALRIAQLSSSDWPQNKWAKHLSTSLSQILDEIWHDASATVASASALFSRLSRHDQLRCFAYDITTRVDKLSSDFTIELPNKVVVSTAQRSFSLRFERSTISITHPLIIYDDIGFLCHSNDNIHFPIQTAPLVVQFCDILNALQFARDHSDTLAYIRGQEREQRLLDLANSFKMTVQQVLALSMNAPQWLRGS